VVVPASFPAMCSRTHKQASLVAPSSWNVRFRNSLDLTGVYWLFEWGNMDLSFLSADSAAKCQHKGQARYQCSSYHGGVTE